MSVTASDTAAASAGKLHWTAHTVCAYHISHLATLLAEAVELAKGESEWVSSDAVPVDSHTATYDLLAFGSSIMIGSIMYLPMCLPPTSFLYMKGMVSASVVLTRKQ